MAYKKRGNNGGKREGAGRPLKGYSDKVKTQGQIRKMFHKMFDDEWFDIICEQFTKKIKKGNIPIMRFLWEQRMGRAPQGIDITGGLDIKTSLVNELVENLNLNGDDKKKSNDDSRLKENLEYINKEIDSLNRKKPAVDIS